MIAKTIKGKGFRGAVAYDLQKGKSILLDTNMSAKHKASVNAFAQEFGIVRSLCPNLKKAVCHVSISIHPNETLTDNEWCKVAHTWLNDMGFTNNQYIISRHTDTKHPHIHILVNRVGLDGSVVNDSYDYKRQEVIMRKLEKEFGLINVQNSKEVQKTSPKKGELNKPSENKSHQYVCSYKIVLIIFYNALCPYKNLLMNSIKIILKLNSIRQVQAELVGLVFL